MQKHNYRNNSHNNNGHNNSGNNTPNSYNNNNNNNTNNTNNNSNSYQSQKTSLTPSEFEAANKHMKDRFVYALAKSLGSKIIVTTFNNTITGILYSIAEFNDFIPSIIIKYPTSDSTVFNDELLYIQYSQIQMIKCNHINLSSFSNQKKDIDIINTNNTNNTSNDHLKNEKLDTKSVGKSELKKEVKVESKSEPKPESKPESKPEPKFESESESKSDPKLESKLSTKPKVEKLVKQDSKSSIKSNKSEIEKNPITEKKTESNIESAKKDLSSSKYSFKTDTDISKTDTDISIDKAEARALKFQRWVPDNEPVETYSSQIKQKIKSSISLENELASSNQNECEYDQFKTMKEKFNIDASFDESEYTSKLDTSHPDYKKRRAAAEKISDEILKAGKSGNAHLDEERGIEISHEIMDEEDKYSGVSKENEESSKNLFNLLKNSSKDDLKDNNATTYTLTPINNNTKDLPKVNKSENTSKVEKIVEKISKIENKVETIPKVEKPKSKSNQSITTPTTSASTTSATPTPAVIKKPSTVPSSSSSLTTTKKKPATDNEVKETLKPVQQKTQTSISTSSTPASTSTPLPTTTTTNITTPSSSSSSSSASVKIASIPPKPKAPTHHRNSFNSYQASPVNNYNNNNLHSPQQQMHSPQHYYNQMPRTPLVNNNNNNQHNNQHNKVHKFKISNKSLVSKDNSSIDTKFNILLTAKKEYLNSTKDEIKLDIIPLVPAFKSELSWYKSINSSYKDIIKSKLQSDVMIPPSPQIMYGNAPINQHYSHHPHHNHHPNHHPNHHQQHHTVQYISPQQYIPPQHPMHISQQMGYQIQPMYDYAQYAIPPGQGQPMQFMSPNIPPNPYMMMPNSNMMYNNNNNRNHYNGN